MASDDQSEGFSSQEVDKVNRIRLFVVSKDV